MKTHEKLGLLVMLLGLSALVWWLHTEGHNRSVSPEVSRRSLTGPAQSHSLPLRRSVSLPNKPGFQRDAVAQPSIVTDSNSSAGDAEEQSEAMARSVAEMGIAELTQRLGELTTEDLRGNPGRLLVRRWAELDPAAAGKWVQQLGDGEARQELSAAVALAWSEYDLPAAVDWAYALPGSETQSRVLTELGYEVARVDPVASMRTAVELPAGDSRDGLLLHALRQWVALDQETAQKWALQLTPGPLREQALAVVATGLGNQDGDSGARFAVTQVSPGPEQDRAVIEIVQRWAQVDYERTKAWVEQFPPSPLRAIAEQTLTNVTTVSVPQ